MKENRLPDSKTRVEKPRDEVRTREYVFERVVHATLTTLAMVESSTSTTQRRSSIEEESTSSSTAPVDEVMSRNKLMGRSHETS